MNPETPQSQPTEPQPTVPPVTPTQPTTEPTPVETAPVTPSTPPSPSPENKKKLLILAGIAGVVILAIIAVIVFFAMNSVSKQDYADAARQFNAVSRASSALTTDVSALNRSVSREGGTFDEDVKEIEESFATLKTENEKLGGLKAVRVGEGGELYKTFNDKVKAYVANGEQILASVKNLRPALLDCASVNSTTDAAARVAAMKECSTSLGEVKDIPNPEFKTFIDKLKTGYSNYATEYEKLSAITSPFGANYEQYKAQREKLTAAQTSISDATKEFQDAVEKSDDQLSVKDSADALGDYLNEQQRK